MNNQTDELAVTYEADGEKIRLTPSIVQQYIVGSDSNITIQEFKFFTELCKARKLNPFLKEAYCIKYGNHPAQIIVSKNAVLKRAVRNCEYNGMESGVIVEKNDTGEIIERKGIFYLKSKEKLVGGWAKVYRKNWEHPTYCSVSVDEAIQRKKDGSVNVFWSEKTATMIEKVAKVRALRETFIEDLDGMYEAEEIGTELPRDNISIPEIIEQDEPLEAREYTEDDETISLSQI